MPELISYFWPKFATMSALKELLYCITFAVLVVGCNESPTPQLPDPVEAGWEGEKVCEVLFENSQQRILRCTFPPGVGHDEHYHAPHFGYTIKGSTFRIKSNGKTVEVPVPAGSTFSKDEISVHEVLNIGDSTAVFLIIESKNPID